MRPIIQTTDKTNTHNNVNSIELTNYPIDHNHSAKRIYGVCTINNMKTKFLCDTGADQLQYVQKIQLQVGETNSH